MLKKIGIVVQRYGLEINGGAEYHARLIAEKLAKYFNIEVFTTSALDYITWKHHYPQRTEVINKIPVHRFPVNKERKPERFGEIQNLVYNQEHEIQDEIKWLEEEGPFVPDLIKELEKRSEEFDYIIFFSYRYYHSYWGVKKFTRKSILVPTAEHDEAIYLRIFKELFNQTGAIVFNSHEEKYLIQRVTDCENVVSDIVGVGSEIPQKFFPKKFRETYNITGKYCIYVGRLDENKGVPELLQFYTRLIHEIGVDLKLILVGKSYIDIPPHESIIYLGFLDDEEKFNALAGAEFLVIPSQFESLSMVALEAWALGKAVVANGKTEVLKGQCMRSNAGLWYTNYREFREIIRLLTGQPGLCSELGQRGLKFFKDNYSWPVIERKYLDIIGKLEKESKNI